MLEAAALQGQQSPAQPQHWCWNSTDVHPVNAHGTFGICELTGAFYCPKREKPHYQNNFSLNNTPLLSRNKSDWNKMATTQLRSLLPECTKNYNWTKCTPRGRHLQAASQFHAILCSTLATVSSKDSLDKSRRDEPVHKWAEWESFWKKSRLESLPEWSQKSAVDWGSNDICSKGQETARVSSERPLIHKTLSKLLREGFYWWKDWTFQVWPRDARTLPR